MVFKDFLENSTLKNKELKNLYLLIHKYGPITKKELIERTKIKKTTLVRMLDELLKNKFIKEDGFVESTVGRRPILYDIEGNINYMIGVHISRMRVNIVLLNLRYEVIDQESFAMTSMHTPEFCIMVIKRTIHGFMEKHDLNLEDILGIGFATIGPLNLREGIIVEPQLFLASKWRDVPIVKMIQDIFPLKVLLEKSANAAVMAENIVTKFTYKDILYFISGGWGIDCGVLVDGIILQDKYADENGYGHMVINVDGKVCSCGKQGCTIAYTSFKSILHGLKEDKVILGNISEDLLQKASPAEILEYFKQGDQSIREVILRSTRYLGANLSNVINLFNPELVILNGPFIYEIEGYYEQVVRHTKKNLQNNKEIVFSKGILKENAAAIGAAILLLNSYFE